MAVFIVLWSCLFTTKLRFVIHHNLGHSNPAVSDENAPLEIVSTHHASYLQYVAENSDSLTIFLFCQCTVVKNWQFSSSSIIFWNLPTRQQYLTKTMKAICVLQILVRFLLLKLTLIRAFLIFDNKFEVSREFLWVKKLFMLKLDKYLFVWYN
jgi:hypothetical protein